MEQVRRESKQHTYRNQRSEMGKSRIDITCPYCQEEVTAYIWSLAGGGKKCPCGALHTNFGLTLAPISKESKKKQNAQKSFVQSTC